LDDASRGQRLVKQDAVAALKSAPRPVDEQLNPGDEAAIIGGEEHSRLADLVRVGNPTYREFGCETLEESLFLIGRHEPDEARHLRRPRAQYIDPDACALEIEDPGTSEAAYGRLGCTVDAESQIGDQAACRAGQDD
jgi:hypothetical protein